MTYHLVTAALLSVAVVLYLAGMAGAGVGAFIAAAAFEAWFWLRVVMRRRAASERATR